LSVEEVSRRANLAMFGSSFVWGPYPTIILFQEERLSREPLLAPVVIYFQERQIWWECRELLACETWPVGPLFDHISVVYDASRPGDANCLILEPIGVRKGHFRRCWIIHMSPRDLSPGKYGKDRTNWEESNGNTDCDWQEDFDGVSKYPISIFWSNSTRSVLATSKRRTGIEAGEHRGQIKTHSYASLL